MNKIVASIILLALLLVGLVSMASPANASVQKFISYCQATGSASNPYVYIPNAPVEALIDKDGNLKQGGINAGDKVAPFTYDYGGDNYGEFAGQNWDATTDPNFLTVNRCQPSTHELGTPSWTFDPATCLDPDGTLTEVGSRDPLVTLTGPTQDGKKISLSYSKPSDTLYTTYVWTAGAETSYTFTISDPVTDELWDSKLKTCRMPDTGAGGISNTALMLGGGALGLGMVFLGIVSIMNRRKAA